MFDVCIIIDVWVTDNNGVEDKLGVADGGQLMEVGHATVNGLEMWKVFLPDADGVLIGIAKGVVQEEVELVLWLGVADVKLEIGDARGLVQQGVERAVGYLGDNGQGVNGQCVYRTV